jgi:hypothetical protein
MPSQKYLESLSLLNISVPRFIEINTALTNKTFLKQKLGQLFPWGWSPATHHLLHPLKQNCSNNFKHGPFASWENMDKELYSKKTASEILKQILPLLKSDFLLPHINTPVITNNYSGIIEAKEKWGEIMVKAPWSSSGRGLQPVLQSPIHPSIKKRIVALIKSQEYVLVEPYLNKILDLSFQFKINKGKANFINTSYFITDSKGQYQGTFLNGLPSELQKRVSSIISFSKREIIPALKTILENSSYARYYNGFLGVDALIYKTKEGQLKINPCLEINLRYTMGLLASYFEKFIFSEKQGQFKLFYDSRYSFKKFSVDMANKYPLNIERNKIISGYFPVTDSYKNANFGAYVIIK